MLCRASTTVPFSTEALKANLLRLEGEWEASQASRDRGAIYGYLNTKAIDERAAAISTTLLIKTLCYSLLPIRLSIALDWFDICRVSILRRWSLKRHARQIDRIVLAF
jgi:hypothetical protein